MHETAGRPRESTGKVTQLITLVFLSDSLARLLPPLQGPVGQSGAHHLPILGPFLNLYSQDSYASQILPVTEE